MVTEAKGNKGSKGNRRKEFHDRCIVRIVFNVLLGTNIYIHNKVKISPIRSLNSVVE